MDAHESKIMTAAIFKVEEKEASPLAYCHHGCIDVKLRHTTRSSRENLDGTSATGYRCAGRYPIQN